MDGLTTDDLVDLALGDIPSARGGRRAAASGPLQFEFQRELNQGDLALILNPPPQGIKPSPLQSLRNTHHALARLLAEGRPAAEISLITGHSQSRISILQGDPMFQELVAYYKAQVSEVFLDTHARLAALGMATIEELMERLEVEPGKFTNKDLFELAELTLDRSLTPAARKGQSLAPSQTPGGSGQGVTINLHFPQPKQTPGEEPQGGQGPIIDLESEQVA